MPKITAAGHPLHPQLVGFPIGLLPFSFAMDVCAAVTGKRSFADAAYYSLIGGIATAGLAAGAGAIDYFGIPPRTEEKRLANTHALLNLAVVSLETYSLVRRSRKRSRSSRLATALSGICFGGLLVSQWFGGHLVYEHGVRVKGREDFSGQRDFRAAGDEKLEQGMHRISEKFPDRGPEELAG
jgi:uncharacterized membrane protein